jgi:hypothetical protein
VKKIILLLLLINAQFSYAESLCEPNEKTLFSANMGKLKEDNFIKNGKILSLCADTNKAPLSFLSYKYGSKDKIELQIIAPKDGKFTYSVERNSPRGVDYSLSISKGSTIYQIESCQGMTCNQYGTILTVTQSGKKIAEIIADIEDQFDEFFGEIIKEGKHKSSNIFK